MALTAIKGIFFFYLFSKIDHAILTSENTPTCSSVFFVADDGNMWLNKIEITTEHRESDGKQRNLFFGLWQ